MQAEKTIRMRSLMKMGYPSTDIKNIFESTADEISLELDLDVTNTIDHIYKFNIDMYVNVEEQAVLYTGYVTHSIMKKVFLATVAHKCYHLGKCLLRYISK